MRHTNRKDYYNSSKPPKQQGDETQFTQSAQCTGTAAGHPERARRRSATPGGGAQAVPPCPPLSCPCRPGTKCWSPGMPRSEAAAWSSPSPSSETTTQRSAQTLTPRTARSFTCLLGDILTRPNIKSLQSFYVHLLLPSSALLTVMTINISQPKAQLWYGRPWRVAVCRPCADCCVMHEQNHQHISTLRQFR